MLLNLLKCKFYLNTSKQSELDIKTEKTDIKACGNLADEKALAPTRKAQALLFLGLGIVHNQLVRNFAQASKPMKKMQ